MTCESCKKERKVYVAALPGIPMSVAMCAECRAAGAVPYDILCTMVWMGSVSAQDTWAVAVANYHGRSSTEFEADAANLAERLERNLREEETTEGDGFGPDWEW